MKRCPECRRDYYDDSLLYCLDDGAALLEGPASGDEDRTAILHDTAAGGDVATKIQGSEKDPKLRGDPGNALDMRAPARRLVKPLFFIALAIGLLIAGFFSYRYFASGSGQINAIAVMPFVNESGNPDVEYLSDGMTEILIGSLSQLPNLNVKARTSVFRYKGKEIDPRQVARDLNVQAILTGRVLQRGNNLTLYVELIDAATENVLWKTDYNRSMTDLVALQNEIAQDVSQKLRSRLTAADTEKLSKGSRTTNAEAYRLYLQGRFFWNKRQMSAMGKAIGYFQQAIDLDPNYALAYAGLGDAVAQPSDVVPHLARREKARAAIDRALALDPDLAEAHTAMAHVLIRYDIDFAGGERELRRSLELDPKWIDTYQRMGELYTFQGRFDEAFSWYRKGMDLEPFNVPLNTAYASALFCRRQYDAALEQLRKIEEMDPNHRNAQLLFYQVYTAKGMYADAVEHHVRELQINNDPRGEQLKRAFQKNGWEGFLRAELERFSTFNTSPYFLPHFGEANIYAQLGDKENAFAELEKSYEGYEQPSLVVIKVYPGMDPLRDDPRFKELLRKLGLPE